MGKKSEPTKKTTKKTPPRSNIVKWLWRLFFIFVAVNVVAFLLMSSGLIGYLPRIDELENPKHHYERFTIGY